MVKLIETVYNFLWGDLLTAPLPGGGTLPLSLLVILLIPTGVYFTIRTKFLPIRLFKDMVGALFEKKDEEQSALSVIQTLIVSTATRVGMGNLVGVVAAISAGGAGAVFWMWVTALIGSSTAFIEATLSQIYKEKDPLYGGYRGGPAYYIHRYFEEKSGKKKRYVLLSVLFAISGLICWCGISQVVSNSVASAFKNAFHIPPIYTTVILVILAAIIVLRKNATVKVLDIIVPIMAGFYLLITLFIIITVKTLLRRPSTWVWGALFPIALSTMFMFMFANLSSDGTVDPVPVAVVADKVWDASTFKDVATSLAKEGDDQLLEIHELDDAADANRALKAGEVAGIYTVDDAGRPKLTLLSSYDSSRASTVLTDRSILETVASSYTQNAELMRQIAQDNPAALADPEAVARALSLEGGTRRVSLTRTTPDGTVIYYYALFGLVAMMSAEFAALSVVDLQPNLSGLGARRCVGGLSKTASLAGIFVGSWLVSFASMAIAIGYVRLVVGIDFGGREGLCLVGGAASALAATGLGLFVGTLPVKGGKASKSGILTGFATTCALFAGLYGEPAMALADDVARACPAECWLNPVKLICDMFNRLYFFEDLGPFAVRVGALVLMALVFVAAATLIFGRSRYEHL